MHTLHHQSLQTGTYQTNLHMNGITMLKADKLLTVLQKRIIEPRMATTYPTETDAILQPVENGS